MMKTKSYYLILATLLAGVLAFVMVFSPAESRAWDTWTTNDADRCYSCHGDFKGPNYTGTDGVAWNIDIHGGHKDSMVSGDCDTCHGGGSGKTVLLHVSAGGTDLAAISCMGCHGRLEDGGGSAVGSGAGLRQHHYREGATSCIACHADSNPTAKTTVGEDTLPPYYADPGTGHPDIPTSACDASEDFYGGAQGLDNDGDQAYDTADPDCGLAPTPGETAGPGYAPLSVSSHDPATGLVDLSYGVACGTTDNTLLYGLLSQVSTYTLAGEECLLGATGQYLNWSLPAGDIFFMMVGNDGAAEGSCGRGLFCDDALCTTMSETERPARPLAGSCPLTQDLSAPCP